MGKKKQLCGQIVLWTKLWIQTYWQVKRLWANCLWANSHSILNCKTHGQKKQLCGQIVYGEIPIPSRVWKFMGKFRLVAHATGIQMMSSLLYIWCHFMMSCLLYRWCHLMSVTTVTTVTTNSTVIRDGWEMWHAFACQRLQVWFSRHTKAHLREQWGGDVSYLIVSHCREPSCFARQCMFDVKWAAVRWRILEGPVVAEWKGIPEGCFVQSKAMIFNGQCS